MKKPMRLATEAGSGQPPFEWDVFVLACVYGEAAKTLTGAQYQHVVQQVRELARENDPTHPATVSVDAVEDFHELRDKGGVLRNTNVRVFWGVDKVERAIVVLGLIKKQNNGPTPTGDKIRMRRRWRKYKNGDFGPLPTRPRRS